jgi:hypothetical protein
MKAPRKVHLAYLNTRGNVSSLVCKMEIRSPETTIDPAQVTCGLCQTTLKYRLGNYLLHLSRHRHNNPPIQDVILRFSSQALRNGTILAEKYRNQALRIVEGLVRLQKVVDTIQPPELVSEEAAQALATVDTSKEDGDA